MTAREAQRRRWFVRQGKWRSVPLRLSGALEVAARKLRGATEAVTIEPFQLPDHFGQLCKDGKA